MLASIHTFGTPEDYLGTHRPVCSAFPGPKDLGFPRQGLLCHERPRSIAYVRRKPSLGAYGTVSLSPGIDAGMSSSRFAYLWESRSSEWFDCPRLRRERQHQRPQPARATIHSRIKSPSPAQTLTSSQPLDLYQFASWGSNIYPFSFSP